MSFFFFFFLKNYYILICQSSVSGLILINSIVQQAHHQYWIFYKEFMVCLDFLFYQKSVFVNEKSMAVSLIGHTLKLLVDDVEQSI